MFKKAFPLIEYGMMVVIQKKTVCLFGGLVIGQRQSTILFKTKAAFLAYKTLLGLGGLSHRKAAVLIMLCILLEKHWKDCEYFKDQRGNEVESL
jgi:hypothetical protein